VSKRARVLALAVTLALLANTALTGLLAHADEGLITPETKVSPGLLLLGVITLVVRVTAIFVLPPLVAFFVTQSLLRRLR
jgi:hypothetical protein